MSTQTTRDPDPTVPTGERSIRLDAATVERLDRLREDEQDYDELVNELVDIYVAQEWSLARSGDLP